MNIDIEIQRLQEELNTNPCPFCGKKHTVRLSSIGGTTAISYWYSDDTCDMFKEHVKARVSIIANRCNMW